jgi:hypothetical protein
MGTHNRFGQGTSLARGTQSFWVFIIFIFWVFLTEIIEDAYGQHSPE